MGKKFWMFKAKAKKEGELLLYGVISSSTWWGDEITPKQFKEDLDGLGDIDTLNIYINSPGGDIFAAQAMVSMLKRHKSKKNVYVDGLMASASTYFVDVGTVYMYKNAMMMYHNPNSMICGNANDMRKLADDLDKIRESMLAIYRDKTGMTDEELIQMLDAETWLTADEALEKGFADEVLEEKKVAASIDGDFLIYGNIKADLSMFKNFDKTKVKAEEPEKPKTLELAINISKESIGKAVEPAPESSLGEYRAENPEPVTNTDSLAEQKKDHVRLKNKILTIYEEES